MSYPAAGLRVFSYLPNPRVWKATIAARLASVAVDAVGAPPGELADWLWDFDARPVSGSERHSMVAWERPSRRGLGGRPLLKTDAFLAAHPFGTIPAAFSPDGRVGVFESNSVMRLVAQLSDEPRALLGSDPYETARVNGFLDVCLLFSHDVQRYILALRSGQADARLHATAGAALDDFLAGIDRALGHGRSHLVGNAVTLADICFVCDLALTANEATYRHVLSAAGLQPIVQPSLASSYPRAFLHFRDLRHHPAFEPDLASYSDKLGGQPFTTENLSGEKLQ